ncbi:chitin synthase-domain-containing protein, partial [Endogone sp. FLAS-F59071]
VSLCYVILFCCSCLAFLTFALRDVLCPDERTLNPYTTVEANGKLEKAFYKNITVYGEVYPFDVMQKFFQTVNLTLPVDYENTDMSALFDADTNHDCFIYDQSYTNGTTHGECVVYDPYGGWIQLPDLSCINITTLRAFYKAYTAVSFEWSDLVPGGISHSNLLVYGDTVLNITYYLDSKSYFFGYNTHLALTSSLGLDGSSLLTRYPDSLAATNCLLARYSVGVISSDSMGCVASQLITDVTLVVIVGLIFVRFTMAVVFQWFISSSLVKPGGRSGILAWRSQAGGNYAPENERPSSVYSGAIPTTSNSSLGNTSTASGTVPSPLGPNQTLVNQSLESVSMANTPIGAEIVNTRMYTTMLVTCYSEGEASLRTTLDSLAATDYSTKHKLFFIIADGIITGSGNDQSTPDICISLLTLDPTMADPAPCTYMAVADGEKQLNMAKV